MKITKNEKEIPNGYYYVKLGDWYIYDNKPIILEYLPDLFAQRRTNAYALKFKDKYYAFVIEKGQLKLLEQESVDDLAVMYPNIVVKESSYLKKSKLRVKGVKISKKGLVVFVLLLAMLGAGGFLYHKKKQEELKRQAEAERLRKMLEEAKKNTPAPVKCLSNLPAFARNYLPYAEVEEGSLIVKVNDTKLRQKLSLTPVKPVNKTQIQLTDPQGNVSKDNNGYIIRLTDYYKCLEFIEKNQIPIIIRRLSYEKDNGYACELVLTYDCIGKPTTTAGRNQIHSAKGG